MSFPERIALETGRERAYLLASPAIAQCLRGQVARQTYLAFLEQAYHHVKHTTPLLMAVGARLPQRLDWLRRDVAEYIAEELGHEEWILDDISAAGGDPAGVRAGKPSRPVDVMVAYAYDLVARRNPAAFFGMVHVLEGTSAALALQAADRIQQVLGLPDRAMTYLRSHGTLDQEHTKHLAGILERLQPADQEDVLDAARAFFVLYADVFRALPMPADATSACREAA